ncbi:hypothetical protein ACFSJ3_16920 [Corallincola platygyrae]|uniref:Uncharacterized protein n=1 Tax=Corallincola platygyrae TaxID=1193278 RepID=A0ABW4XR95_9GAMM
MSEIEDVSHFPETLAKQLEITKCEDWKKQHQEVWNKHYHDFLSKEYGRRDYKNYFHFYMTGEGHEKLKHPTTGRKIHYFPFITKDTISYFYSLEQTHAFKQSDLTFTYLSELMKSDPKKERPEYYLDGPLDIFDWIWGEGFTSQITLPFIIADEKSPRTLELKAKDVFMMIVRSVYEPIWENRDKVDVPLWFSRPKYVESVLKELGEDFFYTPETPLELNESPQASLWFLLSDIYSSCVTALPPHIICLERLRQRFVSELIKPASKSIPELEKLMVSCQGNGLKLPKQLNFIFSLPEELYEKWYQLIKEYFIDNIQDSYWKTFDESDEWMPADTVYEVFPKILSTFHPEMIAEWNSIISSYPGFATYFKLSPVLNNGCYHFKGTSIEDRPEELEKRIFDFINALGCKIIYCWTSIRRPSVWDI